MAIINLDEVILTIKELKSLELKSVKLEDIKNLLRKISKHVGTVKELQAGQIISRSVVVKENIPIEVSQISFNPNPESCGFGRATYEGISSFYGCISSDVMKSYQASSMEVMTSFEKGLNRQDLVIGKWILQSNQSFIFLGGGKSLFHLNKEGQERHNFLFNHIKNDKENIIALSIIDTFLCDEFSKEVLPENEHEYKISATYAELLKEEGHLGLIFPSVKSNGAGLNITIFSDHVQTGLINLELAAYTTYYWRDMATVNEFTMIAYPENGILKWKDSYNGRISPQMKAYYTGKSDDNSFQRQIEYVDLGLPRN